jgi:16S rRNA (cytosine967-C5)-methyltransferase
VNESVELVKKARKASAASLVNAVLRRAAADAKLPAEKFLPADAALAERLGILHSHPTWMVERWLARLGDTRTIALMEANNRAPALSCALQDASCREAVFSDLEASGLRVEPGRLLKSAFTASRGSPTRTEAFRTGKISIQDEASQAIPLLLDVQRADRVLDLCAAPGGKAPALIARAGENRDWSSPPTATRTACERCEQFTRLGLEGAHLVELDAAKPLPFRTKFNRILVDAPCSGTGTLARHPEIRWRLQPEQLPEFHALQTSLLEAALESLAPGGRLVYSTCSLEPEENETVVAAALDRNHAIRRLNKTEAARSIAPHLVPGLEAASFFDRSAQFRTIPGEYHTDGFFATMLEKK